MYYSSHVVGSKHLHFPPAVIVATKGTPGRRIPPLLFEACKGQESGAQGSAPTSTVGPQHMRVKKGAPHPPVPQAYRTAVGAAPLRADRSTTRSLDPLTVAVTGIHPVTPSSWPDAYGPP